MWRVWGGVHLFMHFFSSIYYTSYRGTVFGHAGEESGSRRGTVLGEGIGGWLVCGGMSVG